MIVSTEYDADERLLKVANLSMQEQPTLAEVDSWMKSYSQQD